MKHVQRLNSPQVTLVHHKPEKMKSLLFLTTLWVALTLIAPKAAGHSITLAEQIGDPCESSADCETLGELGVCDESKICACKPNEGVPSSDRKRCLPVVHVIGGSCEESQQCQKGTPGPLSHCSGQEGGKICNCNETATSEPGKHECLKKAEFVGEPCASTVQCMITLGELSICNSGTCACDKSAVIGEGNRRCLPIVNLLGANCQEDKQCQSGAPGGLSECVGSNPLDKVCNCSANGVRVYSQHYCYQKAEIVGETCQVTPQCEANLGPYATCYNGNYVCRCQDKHGVASTNNRKCLPIVDVLGGQCEEDVQCQSGAPGAHSACVGSDPENKTCACLENAVNVYGAHQCYKKVDFVLEACQVTAQCEANLGPYATCYNGNYVCRCQDKHGVASADNHKCLPIVDVLGGQCEEDVQCRSGVPGEFSACVGSDTTNKTCACLENAVTVTGNHHCYKKVEFVQEVCQVHEQCEANLGPQSTCYNGNYQCRCQDRHGVASADNRKCLPIVDLLGDVCEEDIQCQSGTPGALSQCLAPDQANPSFKLCVCPSGAVNEPCQHRCLQNAKMVGDKCESDIQCHTIVGQTSICSRGVCVCSTASENESPLHEQLSTGARTNKIGCLCSSGLEIEV